MGLLERISGAPGRELTESRNSIDQWINDYLIPSTFQFGGSGYTAGGNGRPYGLMQTMTGQQIQAIASTLPGYLGALRSSPPAFAAQMVRAQVLSQARFTFRNRPGVSKTPRRLFGTGELSLLERPWPNATTGQMLGLMEWHAGLAGNAFVTRQPTRLRVMRPDWVAVVYGSQQEPEEAATALDGEIIGYVYQVGGIGGRGKMYTLLPQDVAHWSPIPDPEFPDMGQSWVTVALKDIQGDRAATEHKLRFFTNGATPNMVVKGIPATTPEQFNEIVNMLEENHAGAANAYKTLYLTAGADATVVGADLKQLDFKVTQGAGETRITTLGRVPAALLGISEGLSGSSLNAGNFGMARRIFGDLWVRPSLQDLSAAVAPLVNVPDDAELWFDTSDIPLLREDAKDAAEISQTDAATIGGLVRDGFTAESAKAAVIGRDMGQLVHTGLVSVQLQEPGAQNPPKTAPTGGNS